MAKEKASKINGIPVYCSYDKPVDLVDLVEHPSNPNKHGDKQIALLSKIIRNQGWRNPVIVSKRSGFIVAGHGRLAAAKLLNVEAVPVDYQDFANEAEEHAHLIADNRIAELAEIDSNELAGLLRDLEGKIDLDLTGFDEVSLDDILTATEPEFAEVDAEPQIDKAEELQAKSKTELGQDPPYGVNVKGGKSKKNTIAGDLTQTAIPFSFEIAVEQATTDSARYYFCGGEGNISLYYKLFDRYLAQMPKLLIWVKNGFVMKPNGYHNQYELIFYGFKAGGGGIKNWYAGRTENEASDVWQIKRDPTSTYLHPTQKPIDLPVRAINNSSKKGGIVYEPFSGSGSTMLACESLGRICLAMELDPKFVAVTIQRWADATGREPKLCS